MSLDNQQEEQPTYRLKKTTRYRALPPEPPIEAGEVALYVPYRLFTTPEIAELNAKLVDVVKVDDAIDTAHVKERGKKKAQVLTTTYSNLRRYEAYVVTEEVYVAPRYKDFEVDPDAE